MRPTPPWQQDVILWQMQLPNDRPWRRHDSLQGKFHNEYPDDLEVLFGDVVTGKSERMWVGVIAFDEKCSEYLGVLLNSPDLIRTIREGDNVAFTVPHGVPYPVALAIADNYRKAGLPPMSPLAYFDAMADGLNQYRRGSFGHNPPGIESAIGYLRRAEELITDETDATSKFYRHFFLARCYAEKYETLAAIAEFQNAVSYRPADEDAQMGLLAEYSVLAHNHDARIAAQGWAERFRAQLSVVRERFPPDSDGNKMLDELRAEAEIFDPEHPLTEEERRSIRSIGAGTFRWKVK